jgi:two-component system, LuxR family, sensor kinase FixL
MKNLATPLGLTGYGSHPEADRSRDQFFDWGVVAIALFVCASYFLGAKIGFALTFQPHPVSVLWPPNSILLAALLLTPVRIWWVVLLAAFPAHLAVQLDSGVPPTMILCWFISNSCEALIGAGCVRYLIDRPMRFDCLRNVGIFCFFAAFLGPFLSSFLDSAFVVFNHWGQGSYWEIWRIRFTSNVLAALSLAPLIVTWSADGIAWLAKISRRRFLEASLVFLGLLFVSVLVFYQLTPADSALLYLPLPLLLWIAVRFGSRGASAAICMLGFLAIWSAGHGYGPFSTGSAEENALSIQMFLIAMSVPLLFLAAVIEERATAEAELRETHQRMNLAASAAELGFWLWDIARNEIWISDKGRTLFGFEPSEKLDIDRFRNAIHPDDRESLQQAVRNSLNTGMEYEGEHRILLPNGQIRWLAERGRVEFTGEGKPARMRGVSLDVTLRKLGEEALSESEERFRIVADAAPVLIWMSGVDKLCTFFNKVWLEFTGRTTEQEMGNGWAEGVHPDDLQRCLNIYTDAFDTREPFVMQYRLKRHDGEYRWISDTGVPRYDAQKNFAGYIGSCADVTELISNQEALRESKERMRLAADAVNLGIWEWDLSKDEAWVTNTRRAFLGWPASGKITLEHFISRVHPDDRNRIRQAIDDAIHKGKDYDSEYRMILSDGSVRWMSTRASVRFDANATPERLLGISIDITARKQAELETLQHREELGHLSRVAVMGEMAASIAHELNQPLSGIISNASAGQRFIDRGNVDLGELRDLLADIVADGRRAGDVIRGVQSMVKKGAPTRQRLNLNDLIMNVVRMVNPDAVLHSCEMETLLSPNLPAIEADPIQLQQVLINLVINAFDAMRNTPLSRRKIMIATEWNGDGTICTSVRDYGVGISEEARERLFEQFFTTKTEGLGMGLGIVRSIVESHGGTVVAENVAGGGARFHFTLPASAALL